MLLGSLGRHNIMYTFVKACLKINLLYLLPLYSTFEFDKPTYL